MQKIAVQDIAVQWFAGGRAGMASSWGMASHSDGMVDAYPRNMSENSNPSRRILLIGIDAYIGGDAYTRESIALRGCVNDVDDIEALLLDKVGADANSVIKLTAPLSGIARSPRGPEGYASAEAIRDALEQLSKDSKRDERVFIYYSGHGTQVLHDETGLSREAIVPADALDEGKVIWDYEVNAWLARIAEKGADLTAIFDCCHSAGVYRSAGLNQARTCRLRPAKRPSLRSAPLRSMDTPVAGIVHRDTYTWDPGYVAVAASLATEVAYESKDETGRSSGAFTACFLEQLSRHDPKQLSALRWSDIWQAMARIRTSLDGKERTQTPWHVGRLERLVFGGPYEERDLGFQLSQTGSVFTIQAGMSAAFSKGAQVAVYGPAPNFFPPIDSEEDMRARIGMLRVTQASIAACEATAEGKSFSIQGLAARARLIKAAKTDALRVMLRPFDTELLRLLVQNDERFQLLSPELEKDSEVYLERISPRLFRLGEWQFDQLRKNSPIGPLFETSKAELQSLARLLLHYAHYNRSLRLARAFKGLGGGLNIRVLDASTVSHLRPDQWQSPQLPEIVPDPLAMGACVVRNAQRLCFVVENKTKMPLYITLLNCAGTGRVEILGGSGQPIFERGRQVFWQADQLGKAFGCTLPEGYPASLDRLIALGTDQKTADLRFLCTSTTFQQAFDGVYRSSTARTEPSEIWTAALLPVRIIS